jgi:hypothetical protein
VGRAVTGREGERARERERGREGGREGERERGKGEEECDNLDRGVGRRGNELTNAYWYMKPLVCQESYRSTSKKRKMIVQYF